MAACHQAATMKRTLSSVSVCSTATVRQLCSGRAVTSVGPLSCCRSDNSAALQSAPGTLAVPSVRDCSGLLAGVLSIMPPCTGHNGPVHLALYHFACHAGSYHSVSAGSEMFFPFFLTDLSYRKSP